MHLAFEHIVLCLFVVEFRPSPSNCDALCLDQWCKVGSVVYICISQLINWCENHLAVRTVFTSMDSPIAVSK